MNAQTQIDDRPNGFNDEPQASSGRLDGQEPVDQLANSRAPHGDGETAPEQTADSVRAEQEAAQAPAVPALPWWISEKYHWTKSSSGNFYLRPFDEYLNYVVEKAPKAANAGLGQVFPSGEHGKTQESEIVAQAIEEVKALHSSLNALSELEGGAMERFLIERCTRSAVYAATTQFELVNWAAREAAQGRDVNDNSNYGEKVSRKTTFMLTCGALYALIREAFPNAKLDDAAFQKMARRVVYDTARIEADKLRNPAQLSQEAKAGVEAARLTVEDF